MSKTNNGGPAFPGPFANDGDMNVTAPDGQVVYPGSTVHLRGMSLRDYFAVHADVPWGAVVETLALQGNSKPTVGDLVEYRAKVKYAEADAMLSARGEA